MTLFTIQSSLKNKGTLNSIFLIKCNRQRVIACIYVRGDFIADKIIDLYV